MAFCFLYIFRVFLGIGRKKNEVLAWKASEIGTSQKRCEREKRVSTFGTLGWARSGCSGTYFSNYSSTWTFATSITVFNFKQIFFFFFKLGFEFLFVNFVHALELIESFFKFFLKKKFKLKLRLDLAVNWTSLP